MTSFRGQYDHNLDAKDRLTVPARWRGPLSDGIVLVAGLDPCVEVFTPQGYEDWSQRWLASLNRLGRKGRMMYRRFNASASDETLDSAGRVRIAKHLTDHAGLAGPCKVVGVGDHIELWNPDTWAAHFAELDEHAEAMAEELSVLPGAGE